MKERIRTDVRRYLRKRTGRRPSGDLVLPVVMESLEERASGFIEFRVVAPRK